MDIPVQAYFALGAVFAALVAGFFSYLNLIISKESKISEFRQKWIDSLRSEIGDYAASVNALALLNRPTKPKMTDIEHRQAFLPIIDKQDQSYTSITLRVNTEEENNEHKLINSSFLNALEDVRGAYKAGELERARELLVELRDSAQPLLKYEWDRVKDGEKTYKRSKRVALAVLIIGMLGTGYVFYHFTENTSAETPNKTLNQTGAKNAPPG